MSGLRLGVIADLHHSLDPAERGAWHNPYDFGGVAARIERALEWFAREGADVVVLGGDLVHRGDAPALRRVLEACGSGASSLVVVSGNHDVAGGVPTFAREVERAGGELARAGGDSLGEARLAGVHVDDGPGWFGARLVEQPDVAAWGVDPTVLVSHFPLLSRAQALADRGMPYPGDVLGREAAAARLARRGAPTVVISGHIHARDSHAHGAVLQLTLGALIEPPFDAALIELRAARDGGLELRRTTERVGDLHADHEPILTAATESWAFRAGAWSPAPTPKQVAHR